MHVPLMYACIVNVCVLIYACNVTLCVSVSVYVRTLVFVSVPLLDFAETFQCFYSCHIRH